MDAFPPILTKIFSENKVQLPDGQSVALSSNISESEARVLIDIIQKERPKASLEIGCAQGISTAAILYALENVSVGEHHVIDPFQDRYHNAGLHLAERAGLSHRMKFYQAFPEAVTAGLPRIDFAFIDSSHLFDHTLLDFLLTDKKLNVGGLIGFHDLWMPSLQKLIRFILKNRAYRLYTPQNKKSLSVRKFISHCLRALPKSEKIFSQDILDPWQCYGLPNMVFIQKQSEDEREWTHFVEF